MISLEGIPREGRSMGSQEERRSVMAALRKRLGAVLEANSNVNGWARGEGSASLEGYRGEAIVQKR